MVDVRGRGAAAELQAELVAVVVTVDDSGPYVLASGTPLHLPAGPLRTDHHSLQAGVRRFAEEQTGHQLGFIEQLYTFADLGRSRDAERAVSISYLGLMRAETTAPGWSAIYGVLPWEDRRDPDGHSGRLLHEIQTRVRQWATTDESAERADYLFALSDQPWRPELALQRYELMWEVGLVAESPDAADVEDLTGPAMLHDHRRILATGLSRLRSALQYRPVVFELMPATFTLGQLQETVEAVAGQCVHKQNFRRLVEQQHNLVEPTEQTSRATGGRPARLYRFRRSVYDERQQVGTKLPLPKAR